MPINWDTISIRESTHLKPQVLTSASRLGGVFVSRPGKNLSNQGAYEIQHFNWIFLFAFIKLSRNQERKQE